MSHLLVWGLRQARHQTLALVDDLAEEQICLQSVPGEHHPAWVLGHILLGDVYLLALLKAPAVPEEFPALLRAYGPGAPPTPSAGRYHSKQVLVDRLARTGARRLQAISAMTMEDLARATPDDTLARAQPTIGHHLHALLFHEGYHGGQLSSCGALGVFPQPAGA